jgi:hypothetical protein
MSHDEGGLPWFPSSPTLLWLLDTHSGDSLGRRSTSGVVLPTHERPGVGGDMAAGSSAGIEAQRSLLRAEAHEAQAAAERRRAGRFAVPAETELRTASRLAPLAAMGYHQLADRDPHVRPVIEVHL